MVTDSIGDFIIQLKNAGAIRKESITVPYSKMKHAVAQKLKERGFVEAVEKKAVPGKTIEKLVITLAYDDKGHKIHEVKRLSKPGRRLYRGAKDAHNVKRGHGALILSTPKGILTDAEARKLHAGGEALFEVW
jgi:small subunit ribosomal protein S8